MERRSAAVELSWIALATAVPLFFLWPPAAGAAAVAALVLGIVGAATDASGRRIAAAWVAVALSAVPALAAVLIALMALTGTGFH